MFKNFVFFLFFHILLLLSKFAVRDKKRTSLFDSYFLRLERLRFSSLGRRQVPYNDISNIELIAKGGQGEVYRGTFGGKNIALKRFTTKDETNNYHLHSLNHPNLIKFLLVTYGSCFSYSLFQRIFRGISAVYECLSSSKLLKLHFILVEKLRIFANLAYTKFFNDFLRSKKYFQRCFFPLIWLLCSYGVLRKWITG